MRGLCLMPWNKTGTIEVRASEAVFVHHSDNDSHCVIVRYTERLAEAGLEPLVGSVGDS